MRRDRRALNVTRERQQPNGWVVREGEVRRRSPNGGGEIGLLEVEGFRVDCSRRLN